MDSRLRGNDVVVVGKSGACGTLTPALPDSTARRAFGMIIGANASGGP